MHTCICENQLGVSSTMSFWGFYHCLKTSPATQMKLLMASMDSMEVVEVAGKTDRG